MNKFRRSLPDISCHGSRLLATVPPNGRLAGSPKTEQKQNAVPLVSRNLFKIKRLNNIDSPTRLCDGATVSAAPVAIT